MVGHGDNGPSAKPLFSTFRAEGHVTSTCLWHACRAVTIGALLIVMGMAMSILGKFIFNLRFSKVSKYRKAIVGIINSSIKRMKDLKNCPKSSQDNFFLVFRSFFRGIKNSNFFFQNLGTFSSLFRLDHV